MDALLPFHDQLATPPHPESGITHLGEGALTITEATYGPDHPESEKVTVKNVSVPLRPSARCRVHLLNAGVSATHVAEWAGHSVDVLLRLYAKCIAGQQDEAKRRILDATRPRIR
jgi:hypothetical protein